MADNKIPTPTQSPVPSADIRNVVFAGAKVDEWATSGNNTYTDRLGNQHLTAEGINNQFQQLLLNSGYEQLADYVDGPITFTSRNQITAYNGEFYRPKASVTLPYTTTGNTATTWETDKDNFVSVGDAALRKELATAGEGSGADIIQTEQGITVQEAITALIPNSKQYILVYVAGQSNALGKAALSGDTNGYPTMSPDAIMWDAKTSTFIPLAQSYQSWSTDDNQSSGHAWGEFANTLIKLNPNCGVIIISGADGGKTISQLSKGAGTGYYEAGINGFKTGKAAAAAAGYTIFKTVVMWHQGETDQSGLTSYADYKTSLTAMIANLKTDTGFDHFGICLVGCPRTRLSYTWDAVQLAQKNAVSINENVFMAYLGCPKFSTADGTLGSEGTHYTQQGYNTMGHGAAIALNDVMARDGAEIQASQLEDSLLGMLNMPPIFKGVYTSAVVQYSAANGWYLRYTGNGSGKVITAAVASVSLSSDSLTLTFNLSYIPDYLYNYNASVGPLPGFPVRAHVSWTSGTSKVAVTLTGTVSVGIDLATGTLLMPFESAASAWSTTSILSGIFTSVKNSDGTITLTHPANWIAPGASLYTNSGTYTSIPQGTLSTYPVSQTQTMICFNPATAGTPLYGGALLNFPDMVIPFTAIAGKLGRNQTEPVLFFEMHGAIV